jgi:hypothetical protein
LLVLFVRVIAWIRHRAQYLLGIGPKQSVFQIRIAVGTLDTERLEDRADVVFVQRLLVAIVGALPAMGFIQGVILVDVEQPAQDGWVIGAGPVAVGFSVTGITAKRRRFRLRMVKIPTALVTGCPLTIAVGVA